MKRLWSLCALLFVAVFAHGADWIALPKQDAGPNDPVSKSIPVELKREDGSLIGKCDAWWVVNPEATASAPDGRLMWSKQMHCVLDKYKNKVADPMAVARAILAASSPAAVANALMDTHRITPPAGSIDEYEFALLRWTACTALATPPYLVALQGPVTCWAKPEPPVIPVPSEIYVVSTGAYAYPLDAAGKRITTPIAQRPVAGSTCDCTPPPSTIPILSFGGRFCKVSIAGVTQLVVAGCALKK